MHHTDKYSQHRSIIYPVQLKGWVFVYELSGSGFDSSCSHLISRFRACFEQGGLLYSGNYRECTLKHIREITRTRCQMQRTDKYSQQNSFILSVWLNGWVLVDELSVCGFGLTCSHLKFKLCASFEKGVPWNSGNYRVWGHSETRTWHDKNIVKCTIQINTQNTTLWFGQFS